MPLRLRAVVFEAYDPARLAEFWARLLGRDVGDDASDGHLLAGSDAQLGLGFGSNRTERDGPNRLHLHLTSDGTDQQQTVETALGLGARHVDVGQLPDEGHVVLADPEGNEFCVIEAGNAFLAGCGFLGEVTCEGTREVGLFWSAALDWPLVWDQDQETAVQSPRGGTKVSWGGETVVPEKTPDRQRFDLVSTRDDHDAEVARLIALGAVRLGAVDTGDDEDGVVALADPDGHEFSVRWSG